MEVSAFLSWQVHLACLADQSVCDGCLTCDMHARAPARHLVRDISGCHCTPAQDFVQLLHIGCYAVMFVLQLIFCSYCGIALAVQL